MPAMWLVWAIIAVCLLTFWAIQLSDFMRRCDDEFVGKHDKVLWFVVVFVGMFIGAVVYAFNKPRPQYRLLLPETLS